MKQYDIGFGYLGNGITVWNRLEQQYGDYKIIAHIDHNRQVKFYEDLPQEIKDRISYFALTANPTISATQDQPVFY